MAKTQIVPISGNDNQNVARIIKLCYRPSFLFELHADGVVLKIEGKHEEGPKHAEWHQNNIGENEVHSGVCFCCC